MLTSAVPESMEQWGRGYGYGGPKGTLVAPQNSLNRRLHGVQAIYAKRPFVIVLLLFEI